MDLIVSNDFLAGLLTPLLMCPTQEVWADAIDKGRFTEAEA